MTHNTVEYKGMKEKQIYYFLFGMACGMILTVSLINLLN